MTLLVMQGLTVMMTSPACDFAVLHEGGENKGSNTEGNKNLDQNSEPFSYNYVSTPLPPKKITTKL
jgi:hypothetical protein